MHWHYTCMVLHCNRQMPLSILSGNMLSKFTDDYSCTCSLHVIFCYMYIYTGVCTEPKVAWDHSSRDFYLPSLGLYHTEQCTLGHTIDAKTGVGMKISAICLQEYLQIIYINIPRNIHSYIQLRMNCLVIAMRFLLYNFATFYYPGHVHEIFYQFIWDI